MTAIHTLVKQLKQQGPLCHFIYDMDGLRQHLETVTSQLPDNCEMYYAMKANSESEILAAIQPHVAGFEVASEGEIAKALVHTTAEHVILVDREKLTNLYDTRFNKGFDAFMLKVYMN